MYLSYINSYIYHRCVCMCVCVEGERHSCRKLLKNTYVGVEWLWQFLKGIFKDVLKIKNIICNLWETSNYIRNVERKIVKIPSTSTGPITTDVFLFFPSWNFLVLKMHMCLCMCVHTCTHIHTVSFLWEWDHILHFVQQLALLGFLNQQSVLDSLYPTVVITINVLFFLPEVSLCVQKYKYI